MIEILNRVSGEGKTGRKKITYENGKSEYVIVQSADEPVQTGTPINRDTLMALQGFHGIDTVFNNDGSITETNEYGHTLTTTFNSDGSITEVFSGEKIITKTTRFDKNGNISEVIS